MRILTVIFKKKINNTLKKSSKISYNMNKLYLYSNNNDYTKKL